MLIKKADDIRSSEITSESLYLNRRKFLAAAGLAGAAVAGGKTLLDLAGGKAAYAAETIPNLQKSGLSTS